MSLSILAQRRLEEEEEEEERRCRSAPKIGNKNWTYFLHEKLKKREKEGKREEKKNKCKKEGKKRNVF